MKAHLIGLLLVAVLASPVWGDDVMPPDWRGWDRTTWEEWGFSTPGSTWYPENYDNPYYTAGFPPDPDTPWYSRLEAHVVEDDWTWHSAYGGRQGVLEIGGYLENAVQLLVVNAPDGGPEKWIQIQTTYFGSAPAQYHVSGHNGGSYYGEGMLLDRVIHPDGWITDVASVVLEPNPDGESIELWWGVPPSVFVDQIVVDTYCIPEPASLGLLLVGSFAVIHRRR